jgi:hypothetical protein
MKTLEEILLKRTTLKTVKNLIKHKEDKYVRISTALEAMKEAQQQVKNLNIPAVSPRTYPEEYVKLLKPNYISKDGSIKHALCLYDFKGDEYWLAPKVDLYEG